MTHSVLITGSNGLLGTAMLAPWTARGYHVHTLDRSSLDVTDEHAVHRTVQQLKPRIIVQCAAYTQVDRAESEEDAAHQINAIATSYVAAAANEVGARLVFPSSDYVFNGKARTPYGPDHVIDPINAYGRSKAAGEAAACQANDFLIVRTSWLYGHGGRNFVRSIASQAGNQEPLRVVDDQTGAPSYARDVAMMVCDLAVSAPSGVYHVTNSGATTWFGLAGAILRALGLTVAVEPCSSSDFQTAARRPEYSVLDCASTYAITGNARHWEDALEAAILDGDF